MSPKHIGDEEIVEEIVEAFEEDGRVRMDYIRVECSDGKPILSGRVGSDEELQTLDEVMNDVLDYHHYENHVWVDDTLAFDNTDEEERAEDCGVLVDGEEELEEEVFEEEADEDEE